VVQKCNEDAEKSARVWQEVVQKCKDMKEEVQEWGRKWCRNARRMQEEVQECGRKWCRERDRGCGGISIKNMFYNHHLLLAKIVFVLSQSFYKIVFAYSPKIKIKNLRAILDKIIHVEIFQQKGKIGLTNPSPGYSDQSQPGIF
jgi:hypothetical protein